MSPVAVLLCLLAAVVDGAEPEEKQKHDNIVSFLRKQLTHDNYDYMESSDSDQLSTQNPKDRPIILEQNNNDMDEGFEQDTSQHVQDPTNQHSSQDIDMTENSDSDDKNLRKMLDEPMKPSAETEPTTTPDQVLERFSQLKNAIAINVSLKQGGQNKSDSSMDKNNSSLSDDTYDEILKKYRRMNDPTKTSDAGTESSTARYQLLEMDPEGEVQSGRRRNGQVTQRRRFLQEERPDHIAIVPLDDGPIPEFRLPRNRRQYMGDYSSEMEREIPDGVIPDQATRSNVRRRGDAPLPSAFSSSKEANEDSSYPSM